MTARAQEGGEAVPDSVAAGTPATDTADADTARAEGPPSNLFPDRLSLADTGYGREIASWDREQLLDASALSLLDFLRDHAPAVMGLRIGHNAGPHHLMDGLAGPGLVRVRVDGREALPLAAAQVDLSRLDLARIDQLRLVRTGPETLIEVTTVRHDGREAYSRVTGGTGQPSTELLRGVFANGLGDHFGVGLTVDFLNDAASPSPVNRLATSARFGWIPVGGRAGLELVWRSESVERTTFRPEAFNRGSLYLHGRADLTEGVQAELWAGGSSLTPQTDLAGGAGIRPFSADQAQLEVTAAGERGFLRVGARSASTGAFPDLDLSASAGLRLSGSLTVRASGGLASWERFETSELGAGLTYRPGLGTGLTLHASWGTGTRGASRPLSGRAVHFGYDALTAGASADLGPYRVTGRVVNRRLGPQLPFGAPFDSAMAVGPSVETTALESRIAGPLLPGGGWIGENFRVRGSWVHQGPAERGAAPRYLPADYLEGEIRFNDRYFDDNLEVRLGLMLEHRGELLAPRPGAVQPELVPAQTRVNSEVVFVVDEVFRLWWRPENLRRALHEDFPGLPFGITRNVFGVTWEFFN